MQPLKPINLNRQIALSDLPFTTTADLIETIRLSPSAANSTAENPTGTSLLKSGSLENHAWVAQAEAKSAALFGLKMKQAGFNILVLGDHGCGRTSLMQDAMAQVAKAADSELFDLIALYDFEQVNQPALIKLPVGMAVTLRAEMDAFSRSLMLEMPKFATEKAQTNMLQKAKKWLNKSLLSAQKISENSPYLNDYLDLVKRDIFSQLKACQPVSSRHSTSNDSDNSLEALINEQFFARFRVNILVDNSATKAASRQQAVIHDEDPSYQSLFGWLESTSDTHIPDFLKLRAGNLHKADGGMLLIHLRDLLNDEQNGSQIIEKLYRFLRNGNLQFEDASSAISTGYVLANTLMPLNVKLVMIAMREDFYHLLEEAPDFFDYFPIKVEFVASINASAENYHAIAGFAAQKCVQHECSHFTNKAVAAMIIALQRLEEDQFRISTNFSFLERLMLESASYAGDAKQVTEQHVKSAMTAKNKRHRYFEMQIRDSITDNELLIQVKGSVVGQVNGLTHIELGDASFGSPVRITARCYPGQEGLINIDREVNMSGPNHDKGIFILQNWLSASFSQLAPLSLNASLVFEQEYNGVEGDSASCAELFALLSALANLPIKQGIAITGALNQFGEVMPIGGVNEKIEGYFRVCKALGLDGKQGVIIPKRNQRHLLLDDEVVEAVQQDLFQIITIDHVLEGIAYLTDTIAGEQDIAGNYEANTVMGHAQNVLAGYRQIFESNHAKPRLIK